MRAVRDALPDAALSLDANQSFSLAQADELHALGDCGLAWVEEPLLPVAADPRRLSKAERHAHFERLARFQEAIDFPVCLDESVTCLSDAREALRFPQLRCFAIKLGKFGGIGPALEFVKEASGCGARLWMGGMYDTGISKGAHAAFQTLPGIDDAGDVGAPSRYFGCDVAKPPYTVEGGVVVLNDPEHPHGLGRAFCEVAQRVG